MVSGADFDAIVLAGGGARRMGGADKPMLLLAGRPLLSHVLDAVAGAAHRVVVGPRREIGADVTWCQERPPDGGPVAALAAALPFVSAEIVVVVASDLPWIAPALDPLREALGNGADVAMLCTDGRLNYLAAAWRRGALAHALHQIGDPHGASMRRLVADLATVFVTDPGHWGEDCDSWTDLAHAHERHAEGSHP